MADAPAHLWDRQGACGPWWIPDGSPGKLGDPEIWMDESALDSYARGDAAPAVTVTGSRSRAWHGGAIIRFDVYPGLGTSCVYRVVSRRFGPGNLNRPYYVLRWPD
jgi:hypothetical protein